MALQKDICWYKCRLFMRSSNPLWHFYQDTEIEKSIVPQQLFCLCRLPHAGFHHIGHPGDEFPIGGFSPAGGDGISKIFLQNVQISPAPGYFNQMPDSPQVIPVIGICNVKLSEKQAAL